MSRVHSMIVAASLLGAAGCAVGPYSGQQIETSEVHFDGFVDTAGAQVRLEAFDYGPDRFVGLRTVRAATTPVFPAGAICPNSPPLYRYRGSIDLNWPIYWDHVGGANPYQAKVRAFEVAGGGETPLFFTTDSNAGGCMEEHAFNSTCDFYNVASVKCGFKINEAVIVGTGGSPWWN